MGKTIAVSGVVVLLVLLLAGGCSAVSTYNRLVAESEQVDTAWAQVETVLQRRYDLIPNLVNTVKGFAEQEREVLTEVTRLRSQWGEAQSPASRTQVASQLEGALGRLMLVVERYPELRSNQNFLALQDELAGTENRISVERRRYNEAVREYNTDIQQFPTNVVAGVTGFQKKPLFEATTGAGQPPRVEF